RALAAGGVNLAPGKPASPTATEPRDDRVSTATTPSPQTPGAARVTPDHAARGEKQNQNNRLRKARSQHACKSTMMRRPPEPISMARRRMEGADVGSHGE